MEREADVIVVGAGLSGLIAAREVIRAGKTPLILEALDRVGGRILTEEVEPGVLLEMGAQWIGDTHARMFALAEELGVRTFPQFEDGETTYEFAGKHVMREEEFHTTYADELKGWDEALTAIDELAAQVPVEAPWLTPNAVELDKMTAGQWMDGRSLGPVARSIMEICAVGITAIPTHEISFLDLLYNIQGCGVTAALMSESEGGAQTTRFVGGTSMIPEKLADSIGREHIVFGEQVQTIDYDDDSVTAICRSGLRARGKQIIVAIAPTLAGRITYDPPLNGVRDQLTQRIPQASAAKLYAIYDEPFWRADGLNAQLISDRGPAAMSNDSCLADGGPGIILGFLEGPRARVEGRWPMEQRRDAFIDELGRHFGPKALKPIKYVEGEWADREFTRGCYNANLGPLAWTYFGEALNTPIGPIKWGATETANEWSAYMEGAVEAGERSAREVLEAIEG